MEALPVDRERDHSEDSTAAEPQSKLLDIDLAETGSSDAESWEAFWDSYIGSPLYLSPCPSDTETRTNKNREFVPTEGCPFCSSLNVFNDEVDECRGQKNQAAEYRHTFFHDECLSCSSANVPLCEFCQHLRLQHLLMCLPHNIPCSCFYIRLDSPVEISNRKNCGFCQFLVNAVLLPLPEPAQTTVLSSAQLELHFKRAGHLGSTHTHWHLRLNVLRYGDESIDYIEIYQKFLRTECAECIAPQYDSLHNFEEFIPWNSVREWLSDCDLKHGECSVDRKPPLPPDFRVIDVESKRVVQIPDCEFVALSYVWGSRPASPSYIEEATCENIEVINSTGLGELPKTIEDAISVCKHLSKQYLWVDRYCIVQDDDENKHSQINAMGDIFTASDLTIIACSGANVESELPGVEVKRQMKLHRTNLNGVELIHAPPNFRPTVSQSIWNSRGWTYQEAVLARKKLFLTPTSASLQCTQGRKSEESVFDDRWSGLNLDLRSREENTQMRLNRDYCRDLKNTLFRDYCRHLQNYTSRQLSYDEDVYDAFDAIAHALYRDEYSFLFGIPESQFDQGLLWMYSELFCSRYEGCKHEGHKNCNPGHIHRIGIEDRCSFNSNNQYLRCCKRTTPSWSWASVRWPVIFEEPDDFTMTLVKWIVYENENSEIRSRTIEPIDEPGQWSYWENSPKISDTRDGCCPQLYFALAIKERCFEADIKCSIPKEDSFPRLRRRFTKRWPKYINVYVELPDISPREGPRPEGVLFTRAQSAFFCLDSRWIKDCEGRTIGHMSLDPRLNQVQTAAASQNLCMEFIALSISAYYELELELRHNKPDLPDWAYWRLPVEEYRDMTYFDCNDLPLLPVPAVNVMLICWEDGFARRVTVGLIMLKQWAKAERKFKDVWLK